MIWYMHESIDLTERESDSTDREREIMIQNELTESERAKEKKKLKKSLS